MGKTRADRRLAQKEKEKEAKKSQKAAASKNEVDEETAVAVKEVEERLQILSQEMNKVDRKMKICQMEQKRAQLTGTVLNEITDETKIWKGVGRMFMMSRKKDMEVQLQAQQGLQAVEEKQLKVAHNALTTKVQAEAKGLQELIGVKKMKDIFQNGQSPTGAVGLPTLKDLPKHLGQDDSNKENGTVPIFGSANKKKEEGGAEAEKESAEEKK